MTWFADLTPYSCVDLSDRRTAQGEPWPGLPIEGGLTRSPHLRAMLLVEAPIPLDDLPPAPDGPDDELERAARRAVTVLVRELDDLLAPLIGQLEAGVPAS